MGAARTLVHVETLAEVPSGCPNCGVAFAVPQSLLDRRTKDGKSLYCPNGHSMFWGDTEVKQLRRRLEAEQRGRELANRQAEYAREEARVQKRVAAAHKGNVTRIKNRVKNGVCPCCNRSFENLARHMKTKHPDFAPSNTDNDAQIA